MNLVHNPSKIIRHLLVDISQATLKSSDLAWPAFPDKEPDEPDNLITVYTTEPELLGTSMFPTNNVERIGIQIRVRTNDRNGAKARQIATAIDAVGTATVAINDSEGNESYKINMILRNNGPLYLGEDKPQSGRHLFTLNFTVDMNQV